MRFNNVAELLSDLEVVRDAKSHSKIQSDVDKIEVMCNQESNWTDFKNAIKIQFAVQLIQKTQLEVYDFSIAVEIKTLEFFIRIDYSC